MIKTIIKENLYLDSVFLMTAGKEVKNVNGIRNAVLVMGTELNKSVLEELGALTPEAKAATANSLILSLDVEQEGAEEEALAALEALINGKSERQSDEEKSYSSLDAALEAEPETNLTVISVAGEFAGEEARKALHRGSHVFLFSDNVPLEEEIELKTYAREHGLLVMGPGCGTSVIGGISIGLMSKVSQGGIGIVAASGSGLQEVAMLADRMGEGISQAIGTGGRDLSREVGGITMLQGIELLRDDPETKVIVLVSKPPHPETSRKIYDAVRQIEKPVVIFFLGGDPAEIEDCGAYSAETLEDAADKAVALARGESVPKRAFFEEAERELLETAEAERAKLAPGQKYLRGLFCGGTHSEEAVLLLNRMVPKLHSNIAFGGAELLHDPKVSEGNSLVDMGDEVFTRGRPHPAIDPSILTDRLLADGTDPETAVILFDLLLGHATHPDPVSTIRDTLIEIRERSRVEGRHLCIVAELCGTEKDPQNTDRQKKAMEELGIHVFYSNSRAAILAGMVTPKEA